MSYNWEEDDILDIEEEKPTFIDKDCILFVIDCSKSMLEANAEGDIPLVVTLKSIRTTLLANIDGKKQDQLGILLFATEKKNNSSNRDNIYLMQNLDVADASRINEIDNYIDDVSGFKEKFGSTEDAYNMGDLFWVCSDVMASAPKDSSKRIFLITNNDDPSSTNPTARKTSIQRAKDLANASVQVSLFGLDTPENDFDVNMYYKDIASFESDERSGPDSMSLKLNQLLDKIKSKQTKNRSAFKIPFRITPKLEVGIRGYNMVIEQKASSSEYFATHTTQLQEVKPVTKWQCQDTQEYLTPIDIKVGYEYGGEIVSFTNEERALILNAGEPGLTLLGFKREQSLKVHHQIQHPYFIYPDDSQYQGSTLALFDLISALADRRRIAVCLFIQSKSAQARIVALLPQKEKLDPDGNQTNPPGFQLVVLPYADEIRPIPPNAYGIKVETDARDATAVLIEKLSIKEGFDPLNYENPAIRSHKNMLQKVALQSGHAIGRGVDNSVPNYEFIESQLAQDIENLKKLVGLDNITPDDLTDYYKPIAATKRKQEDTDGASGKRADNKDSVEDLYRLGRLKNATNQYLKDYLTTVGIQPKRLKNDLITQVEDYLKVKQE